MKRWQSILIQSVLTAGQVANVGLENNMIPGKATPYVALGVGLIQLLLANKAHNSNPDGTPASVPYQKGPQKIDTSDYYTQR